MWTRRKRSSATRTANAPTRPPCARHRPPAWTQMPRIAWPAGPRWRRTRARGAAAERRDLGPRLDERSEEVVELRLCVVGQAGVDLRDLDDRGAWGDQPVEPLRPAELRDG